MQWCIVLAACHTQKSTPGHPVRGKRPMWPVSQQLDWHTQAPRTAIIVSACVYLEIIHALCMCKGVHMNVVCAIYAVSYRWYLYPHSHIPDGLYTLPLLSLMFSVWSHTSPASLSVPRGGVTGLFSILGYSQKLPEPLSSPGLCHSEGLKALIHLLTCKWQAPW